MPAKKVHAKKAAKKPAKKVTKKSTAKKPVKKATKRTKKTVTPTQPTKDLVVAPVVSSTGVVTINPVENDVIN